MLYITGTSIIVVFVARVHDAKVKRYGKIYCDFVRVHNLTWIQTWVGTVIKTAELMAATEDVDSAP